jgi:hypothetical protein
MCFEKVLENVFIAKKFAMRGADCPVFDWMVCMA